MTSVAIEYCVPCGHLERAQSVQESILSTFGERVDSVSLVTGNSGVFRIEADDELIFDVQDEEFDLDAIVDRVDDRL